MKFLMRQYFYLIWCAHIYFLLKSFNFIILNIIKRFFHNFLIVYIKAPFDKGFRLEITRTSFGRAFATRVFYILYTYII